MRDFRLLLPALAGWAAAWMLAPAPGWIAPLVLWATAGLTLVLALRWRGVAIVALALAVAALVSTVIAVRPEPSVPRQVDAVGTVSETVHGSPFEAELDGAVVLVFWDAASAPPIPLGSSVRIAGHTQPVGERIRAMVFADQVEVVGPPPPLLAAGDTARAALLRVTSSLPGAGGELLPGLAVGDTSRVGPGLDRSMTVTSLTHLTAVSGANCAIIVGLAMVLLRALPLLVRVVAALGALAGFVVLVTPQPSVLRAAVMAVVVLVALARGRPASGIPVLCLGTILLLVAEPWLAREYGFALSVLATAGLVMLAPPLAQRLERWLPSWLSLALAVPVAAQAACQPVLLLLEPSLPTYGVLANLLAAPAAPMATVLGLIVCLLAVVAPPVATLLAPVAWLPAAWVGAVAQWCASLPLPSLPWPAAPLGVLLLIGIGVLFALRPRVAGAVLVIALAAGVGVRAAVLLDRPADWQFAMCDVGQGDATLARSDGLVMLVDTGPEPRALAECLGDLGIERIDLLVLTHFDLDHVGGLQAVSGRVDHVIVGPSGSTEDDRVIAELALTGAEIAHGRLGDSAVFGRWRWRILWPDADAPTGNDASVTVSLEPLDTSMRSALLLGDLGEEAQVAMTAAGRPAPVDVVKVSHHGSADQSAALYARLDATVGLIGVGRDNGYGHPTSRLLGILDGAGTTGFRTDRHGMILVSAAPDGEVSVWTERRG